LRQQAAERVGYGEYPFRATYMHCHIAKYGSLIILHYIYIQPLDWAVVRLHLFYKTAF